MRESYLECVTSSNHNKYYHMVQLNNSTFEVTYGRIGATATKKTYDMRDWDRIYREKLRKGYHDNTALRSPAVIKQPTDEYVPIQDKGVADLVEYLQSNARAAIAANYKVDASVVSHAMIREAQFIIDRLLNIDDKRRFNELLIELFTILPRKMSKVQDFLLDQNTESSRQAILEREQHLLDVMASQVRNPAPVAAATQHDVTILEAFGLEVERVSDEDIQLIKKMLGPNAGLFYKAWKVVNRETEDAYQAFVKKRRVAKKDRRLFWHGSRTENWWGILKTGLRLRPSNAVINGKMFGIGTYFANSAQKSIGYTSLQGSYWAGGYSRFGFLALFETAYGKPWIPASYPSNASLFNYEALQKAAPGTDCLHAKRGLPCHGYSLKNDEIIFYREDQMTIRYLVELKR